MQTTAVRLASYGCLSPSTHRSLFLIWDLCILIHITWKLQVTYGLSAFRTTGLLSETFLCAIQLCESPNWRAVAPDYISRFLIQHCVYMYNASLYLNRYLVRNYTWQQNSHTLWLQTTHRTMALLPTAYHFITAKLAQLHWTLRSLFNWLCSLVLKLLRGSTICTYLQECCQAARGEYKLGVKNFL